MSSKTFKSTSYEPIILVLINKYLMNLITNYLDLETVIVLYKARLVSEKRLMNKIGYHNVLEMYLAYKKEIKTTHNNCPYECEICGDDGYVDYFCIQCEKNHCDDCRPSDNKGRYGSYYQEQYQGYCSGCSKELDNSDY